MNTLDLASLESWLVTKLPDQTTLHVEPVSGGQSNPTWFVNWGEKRLVLRMKPKGPILRGAHAIEREFRVLRALERTNVPVPTALWLEEDISILGTPFYVMERLEGRVFSDCSLPEVGPKDKKEMYLDVARTLARLHAVRPDAIGLTDFGRPGNYFERQLKRWTGQYEQSEGPRIKALDMLVKWFPENMPVDDGANAIAHGDFRIGNMMFHPTEPRVIAIFDWELSTLGHPLADLGYSTMPWHTVPEEYGGILGTSWHKDGIPTRDEFVLEYFSYALPTAPLTTFQMAFALFRFAVIFVGITDRARAGSANSENADQLGPLAERFALRAQELIKQDGLPIGGIS